LHETFGKVISIYAEKSLDGKTFAIRPLYHQLITGHRVLVTEDNLTTGGSLQKVVEAVRAIGGEVVGAGAFVNRGGVTAKDIGDVPKFFALLNLNLKSWSEEECKLTGPCSRGISINTNVGKGREFLVRKGEQR